MNFVLFVCILYQKNSLFARFASGPITAYDTTMIKIDCGQCHNHCCGNPLLTPVLLPSEERNFKGSSHGIRTSYREIRVIRKKENGSCVFLDDKTIRCTIYQERPLECRLYPFLLDFSQAKPDVLLDKRFCPHLNSLSVNTKKVSALIGEQEFPQDWIEAYKTLEDY
jgi:Fe-S-cluster containining protein